MDENSEHNIESAQRKCCECVAKRNKVLFLLIAINFIITGCLVIAHLHQRNELLEVSETFATAIADCKRHVSLISSKLHQGQALNKGRNKALDQRKIIRKSPGSIKPQRNPKTPPEEDVNSKAQNGCPYRSQKRRKICLFVMKEVSRQCNLTEVRKEIKKALKANSPVYFNSLGKDKYVLTMLETKNENEKRYIIQWEEGNRRNRKIVSKQFFRLERISSRARKFKLVRPNFFRVNDAGIYFVYCQLTFKVDESNGTNNVAHHISKATVLMSKSSGGKAENTELISQVPVLTKQGNSKVVSVSMFTQAYLYAKSKVRVTVSFRQDAKIPTSEKKLELYEKTQENPFNVFGAHLLEMKEDTQ